MISDFDYLQKEERKQAKDFESRAKASCTFFVQRMVEPTAELSKELEPCRGYGGSPKREAMFIQVPMNTTSTPTACTQKIIYTGQHQPLAEVKLKPSRMRLQPRLHLGDAITPLNHQTFNCDNPMSISTHIHNL